MCEFHNTCLTLPKTCSLESTISATSSVEKVSRHNGIQDRLRKRQFHCKMKMRNQRPEF